MPSKPQRMICALATAREIIEPRWTLQILNEIWCGYTRFNDIRRAVGSISPGILSKRLDDLEKAGLIERVEDRAKGTIDYIRTPMGIELEPVMDALAIWAQRYIDAEVALADGDLSSLMWNFGKTVRTEHLPSRRIVVRLHFSDETGPHPVWWMLAEPGSPVEMCVQAPDLDVDLYVETTKVSWSALVFGRSTIAREIDTGRLFVTGDALLMRKMDTWLPRSTYADVDGIRMLPAAE